MRYGGVEAFPEHPDSLYRKLGCRNFTFFRTPGLLFAFSKCVVMNWFSLADEKEIDALENLSSFRSKVRSALQLMKSRYKKRVQHPELRRDVGLVNYL